MSTVSFEAREEIVMASIPAESRIARILGWLGQSLLIALIFLFPIFYLSGLQDSISLPKQLLLLFLATAAGIIWVVRVFLTRALVIRKTFFFFPLVLYLSAVGISTLTSFDKYTSLFGGVAGEYTSFATLVGFCLFVFLVINSERDLHFIRRALLAFFASTAVLALITVFKFFGVALPLLPAGATWNTIGSVYSLGVFGAVTLVLSSSFLLFEPASHRVFLPSKSDVVLHILAFITGMANLFVLIVIDWWVAWVLLIVGSGLLMAFVFIYAQNFRNLARIFLSLIAFVVAVLFLMLRTPISLNLPIEVAPGYLMSWQIAQKTLGENPAMGSGPATYFLDYAKYHPQAFNNTLLWNFRFDRGASYFLTLMPTLGIAGTMLWLLLLAMVIGLVIRSFLRERNATTWLLSLVLFFPWVSLVVSRFIYNSNITLEFLFWFLTALLIMSTTRYLSVFTFSASPRALLGTSFGAVIFAVFAVILLLMGVTRTIAWYEFSAGMVANANNDFDETKEKIIKAVSWDSHTDIFIRNLAEVRLAEAGRATDTNSLQNILNGAVLAARRAVDLTPSNPLNWSMLGRVYFQLASVVGGAGELALQAFSRTSELEPVSPVYLTEAGKVEILLADKARRETSSRDEAVRSSAEERVNEHLNNAEQKFDEAISLKNDYAPAHFYIAVVYERRGKLDEAITKMESVARYNPRDVGVVFQLGLLYLEKRDSAKAEAMFLRALQLAPNYSNARWYLASIYESQGKTRDAIREVEAILAVNPDDQAVKDRLESLRRGQRAAELPPPVQEEGSSL